MVRKFLSSFNREVSSVHQAALLIGLSGVLAKVLALFRDRLLAGTFGAGEMLDIYFASFRVPDFLYALSLILSTSAAVMPVFMRKERQGNDAKKFMSSVSGAFLVFISFVIFIAFLLMPYIAPFVVPGFSSANLDQFITLGRILLLSPLLLGFSALVSNIVQAKGRFFIYALSPVLYNVGIIVGILFFYPAMGFSGLAWGVIFGAFLHFLVQLPSLLSLKLFPVPTFNIFGRDIWEVLKLSLPRSAGIGINQIVLLVIVAIASSIGAGSIAVFQFAYNLFGIPLGIVGISYSVAAFPSIARTFVDGKKEEFINSVGSSLRHIIFWSLPFVVLFIVLRAHIVRIVLGAGVFSWADTRLTAAALGIFSVSILAQGIVLLLVRAFFAAGRSFFPLLAGVLSGFFTIASALAALYAYDTNSFVRFFGEALFRVEGLEQASVLMLALAFSIGSVINATFLWFGFNKFFSTAGEFVSGGKAIDGVLNRSVLQNATASVLLGAVSYITLQLSARFFDLQTFLGVLLHACIATVAGLFFTFTYLWLSKNEEMREIAGAIHHKFWKRRAISPEPRSAIEG